MGNLHKITSSFKNLSMNLGKICSPLGKIEFWSHYKFCTYGRGFELRKGSEEKYWLFDVLARQYLKWKHFKCKFTFINDFKKYKELNLCKF